MVGFGISKAVSRLLFSSSGLRGVWAETVGTSVNMKITKMEIFKIFKNLSERIKFRHQSPNACLSVKETVK